MKHKIHLACAYKKGIDVYAVYAEQISIACVPDSTARTLMGGHTLIAWTRFFLSNDNFIQII